MPYGPQDWEEPPSAPTQQVVKTSPQPPGRSNPLNGSHGSATHRSTLATATECLKVLLHAKETALGPQESSGLVELGAPAAQAQHEERSSLLAEKRSLGSAMEELRATMRSAQEDIERYVIDTSIFTSRHAAIEAKSSSARDELEKAQEQLERSRRQSAEHMRSRVRLQQELTRSAGVFQRLLDQESEAHAAVHHEVGQLQQVVRDLESRLRTKAGEIEHLKRADKQASTDLESGAENWRAARARCAADLESGPLGRLTETLARIINEEKAPGYERHRSRAAAPEPNVAPEGEQGDGQIEATTDAVVACADLGALSGEDTDGDSSLVTKAQHLNAENSQEMQIPCQAEAQSVPLTSSDLNLSVEH